MNQTLKHSLNLQRISRKVNFSRGFMFGLLIIMALLAFELFNFSTTEYSLNDLLGGLKFLDFRWATILSLAFCGIDFAGIARLFTPQQGANEPKEVWYLFGAWLLAASMNAMLTWWGVALAIVNHQSLGGTIIDRETMLKVVPIFVALMVWLIRVLIIGTFSVAGDRLFSQSTQGHPVPAVQSRLTADAPSHVSHPQPVTFRSVPKSSPEASRQPQNRPNPTYHPAGMSSYKSGNDQPQH